MSAKLGKMEKPAADEFKKGRRLFFIPLVFGGNDLPTEYLELLNKYWKQVEEQINDLELKLGQVNKIYHELISSTGEEGIKAIKELSEKSCQIVESKVAKGSQLEDIEDIGLLTEFMDWGRCLAVGLQNQKVLEKVYESYTEVIKNRNEYMTKHLDETLKKDEIGMLFMREGHGVTFPTDVEVFYVSPPALDEIKRWVRDREVKRADVDKDKTEED
jgi:hypothetical protein